MQIVSHPEKLTPPGKPSAIAIGIFDGVHRGHQALLQKTLELSRANGLRSLVCTFDPHPAQVLSPHTAPALLEPLSVRLERFEALGIDATFVQPFDLQFAATRAERFVQETLAQQLQTRHIIVGAGFTFGRAQEGNVALLRRCGAQLQFQVHPVAHVMVQGLEVSSTQIRKMISRGQVEQAELLLGRFYELRGFVERGLQRGSTIGFPTANLAVENALLPMSGVYAAWALGEFGRRPAVVNIGVAPTFATQTPQVKVEAHLLEYKEGSLYGKRLALQLTRRLRAEQRFATVEDLKTQIAEDVQETLQLLQTQ